MVSSKNGPSSGSGLSKSARTWRVPPTSNPSSATSRPGTNSSTSSAWRASSAGAEAASSRIAVMRRKAATNSRASFARITPRLAESMSGLRTHGYSIPSASAAGSSASLTSRKRGTGTPVLARHRRIVCLSRAARAADREFVFRPSRSLMAAATTVVMSSTATTASIGRLRANRATVSELATGSLKSRVTRPPGASSCRVLGRSEAHTSSTPSFDAALTKASVRYVVVGRRSSNRLVEVGTGVSGRAAAWALGFARRVVGVGAGGVVGRIQDLGDLGDLLFDQPLDPRLQRDVRRAAALATAAHLQVDAIVLHINELDESAVAGDRGVDHGVDQLLDAGLEICAHDITSQIDTLPEFPLRANWPSVGSAQQNQGSVRRGGRFRSGAGGANARGPRPAVRSASSRTR